MDKHEQILIKYLPPYTPQLNPIEQFFSALKQHYSARSRDVRNFDDINLILTDIINANNISTQGFFREFRRIVELAVSGQQLL